MACLSQTWTDDRQEQLLYIENLFNVMSDIDFRSAVITIQSATQPSSSDFLNAWIAQTGNPGPIPVGAILHWYNPATAVIENISMTTYDSGAGLSSGAIYPYRQKDRNLDFVFLGEVMVDTDTALASFVLNNIPQTYRHLYITYCLRAADASATVIGALRFNGVSSSVYYTDSLVVDGAAVAAGTSGALGAIGPLSLSTPLVANTSVSTSALTGFFLVMNYSKMSTFAKTGGMGKHMWWNTSPLVAANKKQQTFWGDFSSGGAITSISLVNPATNFRRGSRFAVYGIK